MSPVPALLHKRGHFARALAQANIEGHGIHFEVRAGLSPLEAVVTVPQERRKLDPASDIHATKSVGLGLVEAVPELAHVLEHPFCRDAQLRHGGVVVSLPCCVCIGENFVAMVTCRECLIPEQHPEAGVVQAAAQALEQLR